MIGILRIWIQDVVGDDLLGRDVTTRVANGSRFC